MLIPGIKLTCDWRSRPEWRLLFATDPDPIERLKELGIRFAEFEFWGRRSAGEWEAEREAELVLEEAAFLIRQGMLVHLHPYVHQDDRGPGYLSSPTGDSALRHLELVIDIAGRLARMQGAAPLLVFHAADNPRSEGDGMDADTYRSELLSRTRSFFGHADAYIRRTSADVRVLCENPPPSPKRIRIGEAPEEALAAVEGTSVDLCWDVGHYLRCADLLGIPRLPPADFLDRVQHVHLHSVEGGADHRPATVEDPYLRDCVVAMQGRELTVTLEYNYGNGASSEPLSTIDHVRRGVETLAVPADSRAT